jgi:hypothetical protein
LKAQSYQGSQNRFLKCGKIEHDFYHVLPGL